MLRRWLIPSLLAPALIIGLCLIKGWDINARHIKDSLGAVGLAFLLFGGSRFVMNTGFFASTKFGYQKLLEIIRRKDYTKEASKLRNMGSFMAEYTYKKPFLPSLTLGVALIVLSLIIN